MMPQDVTQTLRDAYDRRADDRDTRSSPAWEAEERDSFVSLLQQERKRSVLELGAATGSDALVFAACGLDVVCTDLSPEMVRRCEQKGLTAHVMNVADLRFPPGSFDAAYAMNCLVHVPKVQLPEVLRGISRLLRHDALFYVGTYGGVDFEGVWDGDHYEPKRFFSHYRDEDLQRVGTSVFQMHSFKQDPHGWNGLHFQSLILRKRAVAPY